MNTQFVDYVELYQDEANEWRWRAVSNNGNVVADSGEGYKRYSDAENAAQELFAAVEFRVKRIDEEDGA